MTVDEMIRWLERAGHAEATALADLLAEVTDGADDPAGLADTVLAEVIGWAEAARRRLELPLAG